MIMKKLLILCCASFLFASCADDKVVSESDTPETVQSSVASHFPDKKLAQISADAEGIGGKVYTVIFDDNTKAEYSANGILQEAESVAQLPDAIIPQGILNYVKATYPSNFITHVNLDDDNSKDVKLNSGLELEFDRDNNFVRIED